MFFQDLPPPEPGTDQIVVADYVVRDEVITITAGLEPVPTQAVSDSLTILDRETINRLGEARAVDLIRLAPSIALAETGPDGTQAQLRMRGAEANHSLLIIDGIKANDPAAGNEARFELLSSASYDFMEIMRGPQSAIWGSEAIGGVVALRSSEPVYGGLQANASGEIGSDDFYSVGGGARIDAAGDSWLNVSVGLQGSGGIDSFGSDSERDGYRNSTVRFAGEVDLSDTFTFGASGFGIDARSEFDGFDPLTFQRADTLDETDNRLGAGRVAIRHNDGRLRIEGSASLLASSNINFLSDAEQNRTSAERLTLGVVTSYDFKTGSADHRISVAIQNEAEDFRADDSAFGGFTAQERERSLTGFVAQYRLGLDEIDFDIALRHDDFSDFSDATSISAGARVPLGDVVLTANYGEGIAQPTFYDLYGFFPGSFVGNPDVKPERSRGGDVGIAYGAKDFSIGLTFFTQQLTDEIVSTFDSSTFLSSVENGIGESQRRGIEVEASYSFDAPLVIAANYSYLDATDPEASGGTELAEVRRPSHRGAIILSGESGDFTYGGSLAIVGERFDTNFDAFPAERVTLGTYALASARIAYAVNDNIEVSLRGSNLFDADYQDVIGYNTQGRAVFVGLRLTP